MRELEGGERVAAKKHLAHVRDLRGVPAGEVEGGERRAAVKHAMHGGNLRGVPAREVEGGERRAAAEHPPHARDPRGVEAGEVEGLHRVQAPEEAHGVLGRRDAPLDDHRPDSLQAVTLARQRVVQCFIDGGHLPRHAVRGADGELAGVIERVGAAVADGARPHLGPRQGRAQREGERQADGGQRRGQGWETP